MIAYVDSSVLLRLRQPDALREWRDIHQGVSSALIAVESLRALDRLRIRANLTDSQVASSRATVLKMIASLEIVELTAPVLEGAGGTADGDGTRDSRCHSLSDRAALEGIRRRLSFHRHS